jgi:molecular chaperone HtpG
MPVARRRTGVPLEVNPDHPIMKSLHERFQRDRENPLIAAAAQLVFGLALIAEASDLPDPSQFATDVSGLL